MKVLFDHQTFNYQKYGGISRYFTEVISGLKNHYSLDTDLQLLYSHNEHLIEKKLQPTKSYLKNLKGGWRLQNLITNLNKFFVKKKLSKGVDVFHPTYYDTYYLNDLGRTKLVLTIYDMIHEKRLIHTAATKDNLQVITNKKILAKKADKIIAISESTKNDIVEVYGIAPGKIDVIYLANSLFPSENFLPPVAVPEKYILFVGNRSDYKNFDLTLKAITPLLQSDRTLHLICAGGKKFTEKEKLHLQELDIQHQVMQLNISDVFLGYLYQHALCFVFPSIYEGFGIPTLEAFACGCPVVLSNTSSMPEVGGDAAVYIDPYSQESIYQSVNKIINTPLLRNELTQKGYIQLKKFSWQKCVEEHFRVYRKLMAE